MKINLKEQEHLALHRDSSFILNVDELTSGGGSTDFLVPITYSELKNLRDTSSLVPGMQYRIRDYQCTTVQANTQSAGHAFDIIVTADSETKLNENAKAAHHDGDTYFANCNLETWELKYCLENDINRFAWADTTNGKGVIYYMKDEWNNECPYDFKNIMFKRWAVSEVTSQKMTQDALDALNDAFVFNGDTTKFQTRFGYRETNWSYGSAVHVVNPNDTGWYYTFSTIVYNVESEEYSLNDIEEGSIKGNNYYSDGGGGGFYGNIIKPRYNNMASDDDGIDGVQVLNNIVFNGYYENSDECPYGFGCNNNSFGYNCYDSTFGHSFLRNTFGDNCNGNSFGNGCVINTFGKNCYTNLFGNDCGANTFRNGCYVNSFGGNCGWNSFGNYYGSNSFGNNCQYNSFGNNCQLNSFGENCGWNSFGNYCNNNSFGNACNSNSFGNTCAWNSFGNYCGWNSFGNYCTYNSFGNYCETLTVFDNVQNCSVTGGTQEASVKNAQILNGTVGPAPLNKLTITFAENKDYTQVAAKATNGTLKIFNPADLV